MSRASVYVRWLTIERLKASVELSTVKLKSLSEVWDFEACLGSALELRTCFAIETVFLIEAI